MFFSGMPQQGYAGVVSPQQYCSKSRAL